MVDPYFFKAIFLIILALLSQGCPKGVNITLYNNSQNDLMVLNADEKLVQWGSGAVFEIDGRNKWLTNSNEKGHIIPLLSVIDVMKSFHYELSFYDLPEKYVGHSAGTAFTSGSIEYYLQLEPDRNLYIIEFGKPYPSKHLYPYPITPKILYLK